MIQSRRQTRHLIAVIAAGGLLASADVSLACTTMALGPSHQPVVAYSYDFAPTGDGVLLVNPAGAVRTTILDGPQATWRARYGSASFNQFGLGMPTAGMNTAGLVVTLMWNDEVIYPAANGRPRLNELEFIQYLLDVAATVDEALAKAERVHLDGIIPIQYFLQDRHGGAAALTYLDGVPVVRKGEDFPFRALTNHSYSQLLDGLSRFEPFGGADPLTAADPDSFARFAHGALSAERTREAIEPADAFTALTRVRNDETRWNIVFDPTASEVSFKTIAAPRVQTLSLGSVDFTCRAEPFFADLDAGSVELLHSFTPADNEALSAAAFGSFTPFATFGPEFGTMVAAAQSGSFHCGG